MRRHSAGTAAPGAGVPQKAKPEEPSCGSLVNGYPRPSDVARRSVKRSRESANSDDDGDGDNRDIGWPVEDLPPLSVIYNGLAAAKTLSRAAARCVDDGDTRPTPTSVGRCQDTARDGRDDLSLTVPIWSGNVSQPNTRPDAAAAAPEIIVLSDTEDFSAQWPICDSDDDDFIASFLEECVEVSNAEETGETKPSVNEYRRPTSAEIELFASMPQDTLDASPIEDVSVQNALLPTTTAPTKGEIESFISLLDEDTEEDTESDTEHSESTIPNTPRDVSDTAATIALTTTTTPDEPILTPEQQHVVDLVATGRNMFYTGPAGCGKSTVLRALEQKLARMNKTVNILAPTGRATLNVHGTTTWTYAGLTPDDHARPLIKLLAACHRKAVWRRLTRTDVLIIDEISMIESLHLERLSAILQEARRSPYVFGGLQIVVTGDFCQLPPPRPLQNCMTCGGKMDVSAPANSRSVTGIGRPMRMHQDSARTYRCRQDHTAYVDEEKWAFNSCAWRRCHFVPVLLRTVHRQNEPAFLRLLQKCRLGLPLTDAEVRLLTHHGAPMPPPPATITAGGSKDD